MTEKVLTNQSSSDCYGCEWLDGWSCNAPNGVCAKDLQEVLPSLTWAPQDAKIGKKGERITELEHQVGLLWSTIRVLKAKICVMENPDSLDPFAPFDYVSTSDAKLKIGEIQITPTKPRRVQNDPLFP